MGKYDRLRPLFERADSEAFTLSFDELEEVLEDSLPGSARRHLAWWAPSQPNAVWADYGYRVSPDLDAEQARFIPSSVPIELEPGRVSLASEIGDLWAIDWEAYDSWNQAINEDFFTGRWQDRPVYLDLDDVALARVGQAVSDSDDTDDFERSFVSAIVSTLLLDRSGVGTFTAHAERLREWRAEGEACVPPFLALLGFLSRVADQMQSGEGFRATNYLGRLADTVGLARSDSDMRDKLARDFRRQSHAFWGALNSWLDAAEGARGLATARVFDWRVHVGVPISQALVKEADRDRFRTLFSRYGFSGGEELSTNDMRRLLDGWVRSSSLSPFVKQVWNSGKEGKNRIAEIASIELAGWDGSSDMQEAGRRSEPIRLAASVRSFPRKRIDLGFVVKGVGHDDRRFTPSGRSPELQSVVGGPDASYSLVSDTGGDWTTLRSETELSVPDGLLLSLEFESVMGDRIRRSPRGVVVLHQDDDTGLLIESERIHLGADAHLLVHSALFEEVDAVLSEAAREGYQWSDSSGCLGLPEDWVLFELVQLTSIPDTTNENLGSLIPIAWSQVSLGNGFALPGAGFWHTADPPEIRVSALDDDEASAELITQDPREIEARTETLGSVEGSAVFNLADRDLRDGDYVVSITQKERAKGRSIVTGHFRLRSSESPRFAGIEVIGHNLVDHQAKAAVTAESVESPVTEAVLRGARAPDLPAGDEGALPEVPNSLASSANEWVQEDDSGPPAATRARIATGPACAIGGGHYWILPPTGPGVQWDRWMEGYCKRCDMLKWFPTRPRRKKLQKPADSQEQARPTVVGARLDPIEAQSAVKPAILFDGICFAQAGSWASFRKLAVQFDDSPWFASEFAQTLSALGHIDLELGRHGLSPRQFAVAPTVLASTSSGLVVLCGYRTPTIIDAVLSAAKGLGLETEVRPHSVAPDSVLVHVAESGAAEVLAELAAEEGDFEVLSSENPSSRIAKALPPLSTIRDWLPTLDPPEAKMERFTVQSNSWDQTHSTGSTGAYRFATRPTSYGVRDRAGRMARANNRWAKWLGANAAGQVLFAYDPDARLVRVPIGARLPGLFERAVVLSSGTPPSDNGQVTEYQSVGRELAATVFDRLTS